MFHTGKLKNIGYTLCMYEEGREVMKEEVYSSQNLESSQNVEHCFNQKC